MKNILLSSALLTVFLSPIAIAQRPNVGGGFGCVNGVCGQVDSGPVAPPANPPNQPNQPQQPQNQPVPQPPVGGGVPLPPVAPPPCGGYVGGGGNGIFINSDVVYPKDVRNVQVLPERPAYFNAQLRRRVPGSLFSPLFNRVSNDRQPGKRPDNLSATILRVLWERGIVE